MNLYHFTITNNNNRITVNFISILRTTNTFPKTENAKIKNTSKAYYNK